MAFRLVATSHDMEDMKLMLTNHALVVIEVGALYLKLCRGAKEVIFHNFFCR
jgi:hypothetical protein